MKRLFSFALLAMHVAGAFAQDNLTDSLSIDAVFNACVSIQESIEADDTTTLYKAARILKDSNISPFDELRCKDGTIQSLNGHLIFSDIFVDSLIAGKDPYKDADKINRATQVRGQTATGSIMTKTCFVKAGRSTRHSFSSFGVQELGIVTEPGGKVFVKVHVTNKTGLDVWHNDNKNAKAGTRRYKTRFNLPMNIANTVVVEVFNKGEKDISFVVISN